eukprot:2094057-Pleurochrysis_carterae.AAC.1
MKRAGIQIWTAGPGSYLCLFRISRYQQSRGPREALIDIEQTARPTQPACSRLHLAGVTQVSDSCVFPIRTHTRHFSQ